MHHYTTLKIKGGKKLNGTVTPIPNKNSIVAALPAALLSNETITYNNVPETTDVDKILKIISLLGGNVKRDGSKVEINCSKVNSYEIDNKLAGAFRGSLMFAGPLLARFGEAKIPLPGGCDLGYRGIESHIDMFKQVDIDINFKGDYIYLKRPKKIKELYRVYPFEVSVTATENLMLYAAGTEASFIINDAASEPHVGDLSHLLRRIGVNIKGISTNILEITGTKKVGGTEFTPTPDFVDVAGYIVAAAITRGKICLQNATMNGLLDSMFHWFRAFNIGIEKDGDNIYIDGTRDLKIIDPTFPMAAPNLPKLAPRPWPGFHVDIIPVMATLACKTKGRILIQNWMYEDALQFTRELKVMGADIFIANPQAIIVNGSVTFKGGSVKPPKVIQSLKTIFLAALADDVETTIHDIDFLKRRYPNIVEIYRSLGADIEVMTHSCD